jgi:hypothetical protein
MKYVADWSTGDVTEVKGFPAVLFNDIGLTGTFDGQGYAITNLTTTRTTPVTYKVADAEDGSILQGSGLFGVVRNKTVIKNVGLEINADNGASGIALYAITVYQPKTWTVSAEDTRDLPDVEVFNTATTNEFSTRMLFENVYIKNLGDDDYATRPNGFIFNSRFNDGNVAYNNVLIDAPQLRMNYGIFNVSKMFYGTVGARDIRATNLFIVSLNTGSEGGLTVKGNNAFDLTWSATLETLLDGTVHTSLWTGINGGQVYESSIYELSDTAPKYWTALGRDTADTSDDRLYWNTLVPQPAPAE